MTASQNFTALANQMFAGAAAATDASEKAALLAMAQDFEAKAAAARAEEAAKAAADGEFWAQRTPMNWVS